MSTAFLFLENAPFLSRENSIPRRGEKAPLPIEGAGPGWHPCGLPGDCHSAGGSLCRAPGRNFGFDVIPEKWQQQFSVWLPKSDQTIPSKNDKPTSGWLSFPFQSQPKRGTLKRRQTHLFACRNLRKNPSLGDCFVGFPLGKLHSPNGQFQVKFLP